MASLTVDNLSKSAGTTQILRDVSFKVADGDFCVLLGPSGCGKTTLLRLIAGLEPATSGIISIDEKQIDHLPPRNRDVAFVFQNYALYPHMSVFDNLAFSLRLKGHPQDEIRRKVIQTAELLQIENLLERKPQQLSGGQRQRVAVGRAIVREPKIFLFDEPLSNLDATLRANMRIELTRLHQKLSTTILYVTHDQAEAMTLANIIVVLNQGRIEQIGSPSTIYHQPINPFVASFVGSPQMNFIDGRLDENGILAVNHELKVDLSGILKDEQKQFAGQPLKIGIRPEDLRPADQDNAWIRGEVEIVEDLGSDRIAHLRCGNQELIARLPAQNSIARHQIMSLSVETNRLHIFFQDKRIK